MQTQELIPAREAAQLLGVKEQTLAVWRTTHRHSLPYVKIGRLVKYKAADLHRWIESRTTTPTCVTA